MVKVEIVDEKESNSPYASGSSAASDSSESLSSVDSDISNEETFFDRIAALVDIVPPTTRHNITSRIASTGSFLKTTGKVVGNIVWIVTTSALLVGLPLAVSLEDEAKVVAQEREQQEQQAGQQVSLMSQRLSQTLSFLSLSDAVFRHVSAVFLTKTSCATWFLICWTLKRLLYLLSCTYTPKSTCTPTPITLLSYVNSMC